MDRVVKHADIITINPNRRFGKPCIRDTRITVFDVFEYLAAGMTHEELLDEFPRLAEEDLLACYDYVTDEQMVPRRPSNPRNSCSTRCYLGYKVLVFRRNDVIVRSGVLPSLRVGCVYESGIAKVEFGIDRRAAEATCKIAFDQREAAWPGGLLGTSSSSAR